MESVKSGRSGVSPKPETPREREISRKVDEGVWFDDWSGRARNASVDQHAERKNPSKCKARPEDSRVNRSNNTGGGTDRDQKLRFVPWCERKT